jgi:hypothetical protein
MNSKVIFDQLQLLSYLLLCNDENNRLRDNIDLIKTGYQILGMYKTSREKELSKNEMYV